VAGSVDAQPGAREPKRDARPSEAPRPIFARTPDGARRSVSPGPLKVGGPRMGSPARAPLPSVGANRREGLLLAAYAVLFVIAVWTVVVSELAPDAPAARSGPNVTPPTPSAQQVGK
jgi:hypothetical protein